MIVTDAKSMPGILLERRSALISKYSNGMLAMKVINRCTFISKCTNGFRFQYSAGECAGGLDGPSLRFCFRRLFPSIKELRNSSRTGLRNFRGGTSIRNSHRTYVTDLPAHF
jgi:hypothetical protein